MTSPPPTPAAQRRDPTDPARVDALVTLAVRGLSASFIPDSGGFAQTMRAVRLPDRIDLVREGQSLRYAAIVALGLSRLGGRDQASVLGSVTLPELVTALTEQAAHDADPGAIALAAWASAEAAGVAHDGLMQRIERLLTGARPLPTVDVAWMLTAAVASDRAVAAAPTLTAPGITDRARRVTLLARDRLLAAQGEAGIFPHALPARSLGRWRAHVGCFADQVYPIQALARLAGLTGDAIALAAANRAAAQICALQGAAGQWWWHYDARLGTVVEGYPVYSVHQHAMAPMSLADLAAAGGDDHADAIRLGLDWLETHPEVIDDLISTQWAQVWRKVGRREPAKAARKLSAVTTSIRADWHLPGLDTVLPANQIDHECRPYELGWLVYAWGSTDRPGPLRGTED
ncbi:hypothetical protein BJQ94_16410 [Cryobacterium sp. SO2]|uniref:hypothetical protein n=1 Tax=Cryobacterium sp. SO2 TaxID=1897060 RepID=UPI00223D3BD7|nr:hypothetical protein [Cryobacterium sp. SO2]WEO76918.1 hypothetical protein BJQ94_16410 [Cryobacterium sp. SO2]